MAKQHAITGEKLGEKLLRSANEMKAGKAARATLLFQKGLVPHKIKRNKEEG